MASKPTKIVESIPVYKGTVTVEAKTVEEAMAACKAWVESPEGQAMSDRIIDALYDACVKNGFKPVWKAPRDMTPEERASRRRGVFIDKSKSS